MNSNHLNKTMMQYFHWYYPADGSLWRKVKKEVGNLAKIGITGLWLPPAYKQAFGADGIGYVPYDLYDLGEFYQKFSTRTKYGTRKEYEEAINRAHNVGIDIYADVVLNHKSGGDEIETIESIRVAEDNRNYEYGEKVLADIYTKFNFPGRNGKYSDFKWRWYHFKGTNWAKNFPDERTIYKFHGKEWDEDVDKEKGNYDYLIGLDIDFTFPEVNEELKKWGKWYLDSIQLDGFRLDAVKHIKFSFFKEWVECMYKHAGKDLLIVGEYWSGDVLALQHYIDSTEERIMLFDVPLHFNFHHASFAGSKYDLRQIFDNTLVKERPKMAVTFVENHDTQPLQSLQSSVSEWFKPLAYSLILLRDEGYPCVFYADYYGTEYSDLLTVNLQSHKKILDLLIKARRDYAYGKQYSYFDHPNCIGWTRIGNPEHPKAMAVLLASAPFIQGEKWMNIERPNAIFYDYTGNRKDRVYTNEHGWGEFKTNPTSVSVWIEE